jgi:hypothetical protein
VLQNDEWVAWANENVVLVVGHDGATGENKQHEPTKITDAKSKEEKEICPLYTGLTCAEHKQIVHDVSSPPDGFGKIDVPGGFPNSWMVGPDGKVEKLEGKDAGIPKNLEDALVAFQKKYDAKPIPAKTWDKLKKALADGDAALEAGKLKDALAAYAKVDSDGLAKKQKHLIDKVKAKTDAVNAKAVAQLAEIKDGSAAPADKVKALKALRDQIGAKLSFGNLAVVADVDALLKDLAPAK